MKKTIGIFFIGLVVLGFIAWMKYNFSVAATPRDPGNTEELER